MKTYWAVESEFGNRGTYRERDLWPTDRILYRINVYPKMPKAKPFCGLKESDPISDVLGAPFGTWEPRLR